MAKLSATLEGVLPSPLLFTPPLFLFTRTRIIQVSYSQYVFPHSQIVCAAYTDVVVKLSATLEDVPGHNLVCNVHGVRGEFLAVGAQVHILRVE